MRISSPEITYVTVDLGKSSESRPNATDVTANVTNVAESVVNWCYVLSEQFATAAKMWFQSQKYILSLSSSGHVANNSNLRESLVDDIERVFHGSADI